jgi:hypothetical protein
MPACQGEFGCIVIERSRPPCRRRVALGANLGEGGCLVIGIQGPCVVRPVTVDAIHRKTGVSIVGMTIRTEHCAVCSRQLKARGVVVEGRWLPCACRVAALAEMTEIRRCVVWIRRPLEIGLMTLVAVGIYELVVVVDVA